MNARACFAIASLAVAAGVAGAQEPVHGSADRYAEPGLTMAWGIARGPDEAATAVVVRVSTDRSRFPFVEVRGIDPFTKAEQALVAAREVGGTGDLRIARSRFADTPRTEWRFFASEAAAREGKPSRVVYYLGIPDTTPEFADAAKLDAYLAARLVK